ncbi:MAG: PQQ-binding-like beta-propeller repeat protein [Candidatus Hydrogenedentes bacterium]|nr:PQQ-binding-like beta-propeller repeat protein [Candidatus Hydrogenedentota bacterium]
MYFGSSSDDHLYCLDAATGAVRWRFCTEGPVRLAPAIDKGRVLFGSDDGWVYALGAADGKLIWRFRPPEPDWRMPGNGRVISWMPVRNGVTVDGGIAYVCSGLFGSQAVYVNALDAATGGAHWSVKSEELAPQGYLVLSPARLFVPTGRTEPVVVERESGKILGETEGPGGAYATLVDGQVVSGPGRTSGNELELIDKDTKQTVASFPGLRMCVKGDAAYLQSLTELWALDRPHFIELSHKQIEAMKHLKETEKRADKTTDEAERAQLKQVMFEDSATIAALSLEMGTCIRWKKTLDAPYALILAGDTLFLGGDGFVAGYATQDGVERWKSEVDGCAYGLAAANGRLYASTDKGRIYCFGSTPVSTPANEPAPALPSDATYEAAAETILKTTGIDKGYCLVLDCGQGPLARELAKRSELRIVGVEPDATKAEEARAALDAEGLYGARVAIQNVASPLPYTSMMANLIVCDKTPSVACRDVLRVLRPYGGTFCIGSSDQSRLAAWLAEGGLDASCIRADNGLWAVHSRGPLANVGEWTELYANPNHTACSADPLRGPMAIQWFGEPGPRDMIDRHHRPMSSLFKAGRLFIPGNDMVIAVDPYNGTPLWRLDVPNSRRVGALKNSGHMVVTDDSLYVAVQGECWRLKPETGEKAEVIKAPGQEQAPHDWGYLDCVDGVLLGTGQKPGASLNVLSKATVNTIEGDFRPVMASDYLFCVDRLTGAPRWIYRNGCILNNGVMIDAESPEPDRCVYVIESRNEKAMGNDRGRIRLDEFFAGDVHLLSLRLADGSVAWDRTIALPYEHIAYLNGSRGTLVTTGTYNKGNEVWYGLYGFDMKTGADKWQTPYRALDPRGKEYAGTDGSHGEQWQHPVIIEDAVYSRPFAFDLQTGAKKDYVAYRGGHGCGGLTGSAYYLYGRGSNPRMYPTETATTEGIRLTNETRPGCWLNIIPAGGLIMIPESSSGCTCGYPLQTSVVLIPKTALAQNGI